MTNKLLKRGNKYIIYFKDNNNIGMPTAKGEIMWYKNSLNIPDKNFCSLRQLRIIKKSFLKNYLGSY